MNRRNLFSKVLLLSVLSFFIANLALGAESSSGKPEEKKGPEQDEFQYGEDYLNQKIDDFEKWTQQNATNLEKNLEKNKDNSGSIQEERDRLKDATAKMAKFEDWKSSLTEDQKQRIDNINKSLQKQTNQAAIADFKNFQQEAKKFEEANKNDPAKLKEMQNEYRKASDNLSSTLSGKEHSVEDRATFNTLQISIDKTEQALDARLVNENKPASTAPSSTGGAPARSTPAPTVTPTPTPTPTATPTAGVGSNTASRNSLVGNSAGVGKNYMDAALNGGSLSFERDTGLGLVKTKKPASNKAALALVNSATGKSTKKPAISSSQIKNVNIKARGASLNQQQMALTSSPRIDYGFLDELPSQKKLPQAALVLHNRQPASSVSLPLGEGGGHKQR